MKKIILLILVGLMLGGCVKPHKQVQIAVRDCADLEKVKIYETLLEEKLITYEEFAEKLFLPPVIYKDCSIFKEYKDYYIAGSGWRLNKDPSKSIYNSKFKAIISLWEDGDRVKEGRLIK